MIEVAGPPERWIVEGGRPSAVCWDDHDGIPSYESDTGKILVFDLLIAAERSAAVEGPGGVALDRSTMLVPRGYGGASARSVSGDHELAALHDDPDALWVWRPLLYTIGSGLTRLGSQMELEWRWALIESSRLMADRVDAELRFVRGQIDEVVRRYGRAVMPSRLRKNAQKRLYRAYCEAMTALDDAMPATPTQEANERARAILREHLAPQQRLEFDATRGAAFYVRGTVNRLYRVELGNGMQIVHPETRQPRVSLCLHPERWIPHADVALAQKLAIESGPDREAELLAGARPRPLAGRTAATVEERYAWDRERDLYPEPLTPA
jgi:hypothetical protein